MNNIHFIKSMDEIVQYVAINGGTLQINAYLPDVYNVQQNHIKPCLGAEFYNHMLARYNSPGETPLTEKEKECLFHIQNATTNLALHQHSNLANVTITQGSIAELADSSLSPAKQWRVDDLREYLCSKGHQAIEQMLEFLEENIADEEFEKWQNSPAATLRKDFVVWSTALFQQWHDIKNSRRTYLTMLPIMRNIETFQMQSALSPIWARIKNEIKATVSEHIAEILPFLQSAIVNFTIANAADLNIIQVTHNGLIVRSLRPNTESGRQFTTAAQVELGHLSQRCHAQGALALETLIKHLNTHASTSKYPEWFTSSAYTAPPTGEAIPAYKANPEDKIYM